MDKLLLSAHLSLAGFVAGPGGEIDWIKLDEELFDYVGRLTDHAGTALYGRKTFEILEVYWPAAGSKPHASKHDQEHAAWYNTVQKYVLSRTMQGQAGDRVTFIRDEPATVIQTTRENSQKIFWFLEALLLYNIYEANNWWMK
jgi:dihydrofolate reductase